MRKILFLIIFLNLLSSPFSFTMEWQKPSSGKEEEDETPQQKFKKPKTSDEELSKFEKLPKEMHGEIFKQVLTPLIDKLNEQEKEFLQKNKWPAQELVIKDYEEKNVDFNDQNYKDLEQIYETINELIKFRDSIKLTSKKLYERLSFIDSKIIKAIRSLNKNIKNALLLLAIRDNNTAAASLLLLVEANIDADLPDPKNLNNLIQPYNKMFIDDSALILQLLIQKNIVAKDKEDLDDFVNTAAQYGALDILKYVVDDLKYFDLKEMTKALIIASQDGQIEMVKYLLNHGANPNVKTEIYITPEKDALPIPTTTSLIDGLQQLIDKDFYVRTDAEQSSKLKEIIELLKQHGANE